jgi:hypothetical protein
LPQPLHLFLAILIEVLDVFLQFILLTGF